MSYARLDAMLGGLTGAPTPSRGAVESPPGDTPRARWRRSPSRARRRRSGAASSSARASSSKRSRSDSRSAAHAGSSTAVTLQLRLQSRGARSPRSHAPDTSRWKAAWCACPAMVAPPLPNGLRGLPGGEAAERRQESGRRVVVDVVRRRPGRALERFAEHRESGRDDRDGSRTPPWSWEPPRRLKHGRRRRVAGAGAAATPSCAPSTISRRPRPSRG